MKTILYDLFNSQPVGTSKYHGGGETIKKTFQILAEEYCNEIRLIVFYDKDRFLDEWVKSVIEKHDITTYDIKQLSELKHIFSTEKIDVLYSGIPYYYKKEWIPEGVPFVGTVHGLRAIELPADKYAHMYSDGFKSIKEKVKFLIRRVWKEKKRKEYGALLGMLDLIITDSHHSEYSIRYYFPEYARKQIHVLYPPLKKTDIIAKNQPSIQDPYILLMGGDRYEKNCYREILSIENLIRKGYLDEYKIIVIGNISNKIRRIIQDPDRYIIKDYIEADELETLYKFCAVFYYVSLNEGFGIPPLEAMRYGTTCVVSGVCSLPEVYGEGVYYANPTDVDEMGSRLLYATGNRIDKEKVKTYFNRIVQKQNEDLKEICRLLIQ